MVEAKQKMGCRQKRDLGKTEGQTKNEREIRRLFPKCLVENSMRVVEKGELTKEGRRHHAGRPEKSGQ